MSEKVLFNEIKDHSKLTSEELLDYIRFSNKIKKIRENVKQRHSYRFSSNSNPPDICVKIDELNESSFIWLNNIDQSKITFEILKEFCNIEYNGKETKEDFLTHILNLPYEDFENLIHNINFNGLSEEFYKKNKKRFFDAECLDCQSFFDSLNEDEAITYLCRNRFINLSLNKYGKDFFLKLSKAKDSHYLIRYIPLEYRRECYDIYNEEYNTFEICDVTIKITDYDKILKHNPKYLTYLLDKLSLEQIKEIIKVYPYFIESVYDLYSEKTIKELFNINPKILSKWCFKKYNKKMLLKYFEVCSDNIYNGIFLKYVKDKDVQEKMLDVCKSGKYYFYRYLSLENKLKLNPLEILDVKTEMDTYIPEEQKDLKYYKKLYENAKSWEYGHLDKIPEKYVIDIVLEK